MGGAQKQQATNDAVAMGVGLVLFWPALFCLAGGNDRKEELSRLKGEYEPWSRRRSRRAAPWLPSSRRAAATDPLKGRRRQLLRG